MPQNRGPVCPKAIFRAPGRRTSPHALHQSVPPTFRTPFLVPPPPTSVTCWADDVIFFFCQWLFVAGGCLYMSVTKKDPKNYFGAVFSPFSPGPGFFNSLGWYRESPRVANRWGLLIIRGCLFRGGGASRMRPLDSRVDRPHFSSSLSPRPHRRRRHRRARCPAIPSSPSPPTSRTHQKTPRRRTHRTRHKGVSKRSRSSGIRQFCTQINAGKHTGVIYIFCGHF